ncbi:MAG: hypothetical protein P8M80_04920 [Pirellulaceae bacterium]|nr:hypothetical protein [Pirellulaceae bacterium]
MKLRLGKTGDPVKPLDEESGLDNGFEATLNPGIGFGFLFL